MYWPETDKINSYGNILHYLGFGFTSFNGKKESEVKDFKKIINYASGAAVMFKSSVLREVGLFDRSFFMYHEDTDLSLRMKFLGYQIKFVPEAKVFHQYKFSKSIKKFYFIERNRFIILLKFYKIFTLILILPALIFLEMGLLVQSFISGFFRERLKVYFYFLNPINLIRIFKKRRIIQKNRVIKDSDLFKELSGKIDFQEIDNFFLSYVFNPLLKFYKMIIERLIFW
jgi:GT2 family glycosyltransferase